VKAIMPTPGQKASLAVRKIVSIHRTPRRPAAEPRQWMLTTWTYQSRSVQTPVAMDGSEAPRMTFTVVETRQKISSYAAVATANGWLIIQL
jgi:hypothetical protein